MDAIYLRFPEGKTKAVTLSYDDGTEQDARLIGLMKKYGLRGTFNINSGCYAPEDYVHPKGSVCRRMTRTQSIDLYKDSGMEVAVHAYMHPHLYTLPQATVAYELLRDREELEKDFGTVIRGMAYPYGLYHDDMLQAAKVSGIVYSRTVKQSESFALPMDWLQWNGTCHHNNPRVMELAKDFVTRDVKEEALLYYLWGHTFEFEADDNWNVIEEFAEFMGGREDIWYATNIDIYEYVTAFQQLVFSVDGQRVYNPTAHTLYFTRDGKEICIHPGERI